MTNRQETVFDLIASTNLDCALSYLGGRANQAGLTKLETFGPHAALVKSHERRIKAMKAAIDAAVAELLAAKEELR